MPDFRSNILIHLKKGKLDMIALFKRAIKFGKVVMYFSLAWLIFLVFQPLVTSLSKEFADWLAAEDSYKVPCHVSETWLGVLLCSLSAVIATYVLYKRKRYGYRASDKEVAVATFVVSLYAYYRLWNNAFEFWPSSCILAYTDSLLIPCFVFAFCLWSSKKKEAAAERDRLLNDDPIEDKQSDQFSHYSFALSMLSDLDTVDLSKKAYSVGVAGPWGQGKSSFLTLLTKEAEEKGYIVINFNPRHAATPNSIQSEFFESFTEVLSNYHSGVRNAVRKYTSELGLPESGNYLVRLVTMVFSKFSATSIDDVNNIISQINRRVIVVMEDLDRLTAPEILEVFKLIDRNGSFRNTIFVTAYDKEYVNEVLENYLGYEENKLPFTDKYFNFEFTLPQQPATSLRTHLINAIYNLLRTDNDKDNTKLSTELRSTVSNNAIYISSALTSMRHVKRFSNIFSSRFRAVQKDVNFTDFFLLTLLRYMDFGVYNLLVSDSILMRGGGGLSNSSRKQLYLVNEYSKHFNAKWDYTCNILEKLFSRADDNSLGSEDVYGRIRYANSFHLYFYDYTIGDIKYDDVIKLYSTKDFKEITSEVDGYLKNSREAFCDFLINRKAGWFETSSAYEKNAKMLLYVNDKNDVDQSLNLYHIIDKDTRDEAVKQELYDGNDAYKNAMQSVVKEMMIYRSWQIGYSLNGIINCILDGSYSEKDFIFTRAELATMSLQCQKIYYSAFGNSEWSYAKAVMLANIPTSIRPKKYDEEAAYELHNLLSQHADDAITAITHHFKYPSSDGTKIHITIKLLDDYYPQLYYPTHNLKFSDFIKEIDDADKAFVVERIYEAMIKNDFVTVECPNGEIGQGDFKKYRELIEASDRTSIVKVCKENFICDYSHLANLCGLSMASVKELVPQLVKEERIEGRIGKLRDKMDDYRPGDYVMIKSTAIEKSKKRNKNLDPDALYKISNISEGKFFIKYHNQSYTISDLLPVPINGIADKDLYWDPVVAASVVPDGEPIPVSKKHDGYYLDTLKKTFNSKNVNLYNQIISAGCKYVHEAQHVLEETDVDVSALKYHHRLINLELS